MALVCMMLSVSACSIKYPVSENDKNKNVEAAVDTEDNDTKSDASETGDESVRIVHTAQALEGQNGLKYIENDRIEQGYMQQIHTYQSNLLVSGTDLRTNSGPGFSVALLSLETGEGLSEASFSQLEVPGVQVCKDLIAVTDQGTHRIYLLDGSLQVVKEYRGDERGGNIYVNTDMSKCYQLFGESGIRETVLASGEQRWLLENVTGLYSNSQSADSITLSYTDTTTMFSYVSVLDLATGELMEIPFEGSFYGGEYSDGIWKCSLATEESTYYIGRDHRPKELTLDGDSTLRLLSDPTRFLVTAYEEGNAQTLTVYETDGHFLSRCYLDMEGRFLCNDMVWSEVDGGYYFIASDGVKSDRLLFWDFSVPVSGIDLQLKNVVTQQQIEGKAVSRELFDRVEALSEKYSVEIFIADECSETYGDYSMTLETDEMYVKSAVDTLEQVLAAYPDGFMEQLAYGTQKKTEIHLTGALVKDTITENDTGFTTYNGVAMQENGKNLMVLDITNPGSLEAVLYHEIAHLIDYKIIFDASIRKDAVYSYEKWQALNPEGYEYPGSVINLSDEFYMQDYSLWFMDLYGQTTIQEDKATFMENAMIGNDWIFASSDYRQAKLAYWCQCIRDAFDTTGWPELTVWEEMLAGCS